MTKIQTKAYFDSDIKPKIIELLQTAKQEVFVASAWFNDKDLYNILLCFDNIKVKVLIKKDEERNTLDWKKLGKCGIKVYQLIKENEGRSLMHNKFCVIDNEIVITGSYNWTNGANHNNYENIVVIEGDTQLNFQYKEQFNRLVQPIIDFFDAKKRLLNENTDSYITKKRAEVEAHFEEVEKVKQWMIDYMEMYNEMPPEQLTNQQFSKKYGDTSASDIGKGVVAYGNSIIKYGTSLLTSDEKKDWWENKLSSDLKNYFYKEKFQLNVRHTNYPGNEAIDSLFELTYFSSRDISNITGLEYLTKLTRIELQSPKLIEFPDLSSLEFLKSLFIYNTGVTSLNNISKLINLEYLSCFKTPLLSLIGIEKLPKLDTIVCHPRYKALPIEKQRLERLGFTVEKESPNSNGTIFWQSWIHKERSSKPN